MHEERQKSQVLHLRRPHLCCTWLHPGWCFTHSTCDTLLLWEELTTLFQAVVSGLVPPLGRWGCQFSLIGIFSLMVFSLIQPPYLQTKGKDPGEAVQGGQCANLCFPTLLAFQVERKRKGEMFGMGAKPGKERSEAPIQSKVSSTGP